MNELAHINNLLLLKQKKKTKNIKKGHKDQAHLKGEFFFPIASRNLF